MSKTRSHKLLPRFLNLLLITILVTLSSATNAAHIVYADSGHTDEIKIILDEYSDYLGTGKTPSPNFFSNNIDNLIRDRRSYYKKFFEVALNSKLLEVSSSFVTDHNTSILQDTSTITFIIFEEVKFIGKAKTKSVDEYPMIKAANHASKLAEQRLAKDNKKLVAVKKELGAYVKSTKEAIDQSIKENYEITNIVRHEIVFSVDDSGLKIVQDSFSDQSNDNLEGTDIVYWKNGLFYRIEPDMTTWPDYKIQNTPVETLAESLFADINGGTASTPDSITTVTYNRTAAKDYANTWVRNTTYHCTPYDTDPLQDTDYYNYTQYIDFGCNDCTNYVSQALNAGDIPTDSTWQPYTTAWINVDSLQQYLVNQGRGSFVSSSSSLTTGDLGMIYSGGVWQHVVMVVGLNPLRYSAHTNDRRSVNWSSSLNKYFHMNNSSS